jgi:hypothetical protein
MNESNISTRDSRHPGSSPSLAPGHKGHGALVSDRLSRHRVELVVGQRPLGDHGALTGIGGIAEDVKRLAATIDGGARDHRGLLH